MHKTMLNIILRVLTGIKLSKARQLISIVGEGSSNVGFMILETVCLATPTSKHVCYWSFYMHKTMLNLLNLFLIGIKLSKARQLISIMGEG